MSGRRNRRDDPLADLPDDGLMALVLEDQARAQAIEQDTDTAEPTHD
jgi:hypothetical protein